MTPQTLVDLARWRAAVQPDDRVYTFLSDGGAEEATLTYRQLDRGARRLAAALQSKSQGGDRAVLLYPSGLDYITAFWGCLFAGIIPVPAYPPRANRSSERLELLVADAQPTLCLTTQKIRHRMHPAGDWSRFVWLATDAMEPYPEDAWREPHLERDSIALLQYTSGSTRDPRGVVVTHGNLLHNLEQIAKAFQLDAASTLVSWLPLYHDMGLIGGILEPLYAGFSCVLLSSTHFLQRPVCWLEAMTRYGATISGGPNFGYELCVQRIRPDEVKRLDLSKWRVAFNGAEPIRQRTLDRFVAAFEGCGFRRAAFQPCYGLAESTLLVAGAKLQREPVSLAGRPDRDGRNLAHEPASGSDIRRSVIGCGRPADNLDVVIVDPRTYIPCPSGAVGEIWLSGPSVARGYWNRALETEQTFSACLVACPEKHFLRTGDLGFLFQGELFITGRLKDVIVIGGRNYYPQDFEWTVERSHEALRAGAGAAFAVDHQDHEALVIVHELQPRWQGDAASVLESIRLALGEEHELSVHAVVLIRAGTLPRTSSGKVQRHRCCAEFHAGTLEVIAEWGAQDQAAASVALDQDAPAVFEEDAILSVTRTLGAIWCDVMGAAPESESTNFFAINGNSLTACQLVARVNERFGMRLSHDVLFHAPTFGELARCIHGGVDGANDVDMRGCHRARTSDVLPLSFAQQRMWFQEQLVPGNAFYNIGIRADVSGPIDLRAVVRALGFLEERHEVLRARFPIVDGRPVQVIGAMQPTVIPVVDVSGLPGSLRDTEAQRIIDREAHRAFDFEGGPLYRMWVLKAGGDAHVVLLVLHHIVCDGWGVVVFIKDFNAAYSAYAKGAEPSLAPLPIQFRDVCTWQHETFQESREYGRQAQYWRQRFADGLPPTMDLPTDFSIPHPARNRGAQVSVELEHELTAQIRTFAQTQNVTVFVVMLCAMNILLHRWTGHEDLVVGTVAAHRNRIDLQEIVGCLFNFLALRTSMAQNPSGLEALERVRRVVQEAVAHQEYPFERLVNDVNPARRSRRNPVYAVGFWFHNRPLPRLFDGELMTDTSLIDTHTSDLDLRVVAAETAAGGLHVSFEFSTDVFRRSTMRAVMRAYQTVLRTLVCDPERRVSDFELDGALRRKGSRGAMPATAVRAAVTANFMVEALEPVLSFWTARWGIEAAVEVVPYHVMMQRLLAPPPGWIPIILLSFEQWVPDRPADAATASFTPVREELRLLLDAVRHWSERSEGKPLLVGVCPESPAAVDQPGRREDLREMSRRLRAELDGMKGVQFLDLAEAAALYRVTSVHYGYRDELGSMPFTTDFFAAAGTRLARTLYGLLHPRYKVIVLDCDHTLWSGVCGEAIPEDLGLTPPYVFLQNFMLEQQRGGRLLCLSSANNEEDVLDVFRGRPDMPLRLDHFVATRINWARKFQNLKSIAAELNVSLESFIVIDDDPLVCEEIREYCPEALTLQLPSESEAIPEFLAHVWAFDLWKPTEEDGQRTALYTQNRERERLRAQSPSPAQFLDQLEIRVLVEEMTSEHAPRVAQLIQRTNQFNLTLVRRSEPDVRRLLRHGTHRCWVVRLRDRFGDYGLVGVLIAEPTQRRLTVDTFLLSCRALGRRVEHRMTDVLIESAAACGCSDIHIPFVRTPKNIPAQTFMEAITGVPLSSDRSDQYLSIPAETMGSNLAALEAAPYAEAPRLGSDDGRSPNGEGPNLEHQPDAAARLNALAAELRSADRIKAALRSEQAVRPKLSTAYVAPRTRVETRLVRLWCDVLQLDRVGIHDNFFECGGHSLLATQLLARVEAEFGVGVGLPAFFDAPTVDGLARAIAAALVKQTNEGVSRALLQELAELTEAQAQAMLDRTASCRSGKRDDG
jgi:FkbH-like protein